MHGRDSTSPIPGDRAVVDNRRYRTRPDFDRILRELERPVPRSSAEGNPWRGGAARVPRAARGSRVAPDRPAEEEAPFLPSPGKHS